MAPFPMTLSDPKLRFQGHGVIFRPIDALNVLCAQLTSDLFAIAKFLLIVHSYCGLEKWYDIYIVDSSTAAPVKVVRLLSFLQL